MKQFIYRCHLGSSLATCNYMVEVPIFTQNDTTDETITDSFLRYCSYNANGLQCSNQVKISLNDKNNKKKT